MTANERNELEIRIKLAFSDRVFVQELFALNEPEDVQIKLQDKGISLSLDEIRMIPRALRKAMEQNSELSDEDLEQVAAGTHLGIVSFLAGCLAVYHTSVKNWNW